MNRRRIFIVASLGGLALALGSYVIWCQRRALSWVEDQAARPRRTRSVAPAAASAPSMTDGPTAAAGPAPAPKPEPPLTWREVEDRGMKNFEETLAWTRALKETE